MAEYDTCPGALKYMDSKQTIGCYVATRYDVRKGDITFESCVIMNQ